MSTNLTTIKTLVIKIGTSLLSGPGGFDGQVLESVVKEVAALKCDRSFNVLIVSSGAIGCGMNVLEMEGRPKSLPLKQASAAVGQSRLMHCYEALFERFGHGLLVAQVLLSTADLDHRQSYLNIRNTIKTLFDLGSVVPIVNENDSVATEELSFGDNDTLAARVAAKIDADLLIILSDVDGLYDKDPAKGPDARFIEHVETVTGEIEALADDTWSETTIGGMKTKLAAARIACTAGVPVVIANGRRTNVIHDVLAGKGRATTFAAAGDALPHRKRWIAFGRAIRGTVQLDEGACRAVLHEGKSLLAAGVTEVTGDFEIGTAVRITDGENHHIATGLVNYSSADIEQLKGCKSHEIQAILGRKDYDEVIHRDNLVVLPGDG